MPKTSYYWRKVLPLLTPHHTVVVPDMRGLGDSEHADTGYDMATVADDFAALIAHLGHDRYRVVGEDWGAPPRTTSSPRATPTASRSSCTRR